MKNSEVAAESEGRCGVRDLDLGEPVGVVRSVGVMMGRCTGDLLLNRIGVRAEVSVFGVERQWLLSLLLVLLLMV